jgi:hypothetical protein
LYWSRFPVLAIEAAENPEVVTVPFFYAAAITLISSLITALFLRKG